MSTTARVWVLFWSLFYGLFYGIGAPLLRLLSGATVTDLRQFGLVKVLIGIGMLFSIALLLRQRPIGPVVNAVCWGAYLSIFVSVIWSSWLFVWSRGQESIYVAGLGVPVALTCLWADLRDFTRRQPV